MGLIVFSHPRVFWSDVPAYPLTLYRRVFGFILLLEQLYMTDGVIHVVYENWEPCFVPLFREMEIPVTHFWIDSALYAGIFFALLMMFDNVLPTILNRFVPVLLLFVYAYVRIIHFYNWNNHYYLNMLVLFMFVFIPGQTRSETRPRWEYLVIQFFYGIVYFFAGVSKISSAWLEGLITETMTENHGLLLPNLMLSWGGLLLDLLGGLQIMVNCFFSVSKELNVLTHVGFWLFHLHNLGFLFKSIQFFPLHMLFTPLVFVGSVGIEPKSVDPKPRKSWSARFLILWAVVIAQGLFATRRFFILVDHPWEIMKANDISEFHSQVHHFSWRMKSRTVQSAVLTSGRWPTMMAVGITPQHTQPESRQYIWFTKVFFNKVMGDPECGIQPLVNRVRRQMPGADPQTLSVNLFWWGEVNHGPYQLLVNPNLNFVGAQHTPQIAAPPATHVESQVVPPPDWKARIAVEAREADSMGLSLAAFVARADDIWIPNPLIAATDPELMPKLIVCSDGEIVLRIKAQEFACEGASYSLPADGQFHLKFKTQALFFLAFVI